MSLITSQLVAYLYAFYFSVQFNINVDHCPIDFSSKVCVTGAYGCNWHGYYSYKEERIVINHNHWKEIHPAHRRELIWHELGHCIGLRHVTTVDIMRPRVYSTKTDYSNWDYLVKRLGLQIEEARKKE
jgi:hypothetical protein